ncbi:MAG TPA: hypothetical protein VKB78_14805, partial [Pirellulales bacterium]|nr:hypothetical protein [Pirellulales bacterium]
MIGRWGFYRVVCCAVGLATAIVLLVGDAAQAQARRAPPTGFRRLAPGVETTIPAKVDPHDTVTYHNIVELLAPSVVADLGWTPNFISSTKTLRALSTNRDFRSTTWYLQFIFKPLRVIQVDLP